MSFVCKLYYFEEYETPIGRMESIRHGDPVGTQEQWRYKYEKVKNYFREEKFDDEFKANEWGQEQMYYDSECHYEISTLTP